MNRKLTNILLLALSLAGAYAEPEVAPVAPAKEATAPVSPAAAAKAQLIDSVSADLKAIKDQEGRSKEVAALVSLIGALQRATPGQISDPGGIDVHFEYNLSRGQPSDKTRVLYQDFIRLTREEVAAERKNAIAETRRITRELLGKAILNPTAEDAGAGESRLEALSGELRQSRSAVSGEMMSALNQLEPVLESIHLFHQFRVAGDLSRMAGALDSVLQNLRRMTLFLTAEEATAHVESLRKQSGLPTPAELAQLPKQLLGELLDEANQDKLDEIRAKVERYRSLATSSSAYSNSRGGARSWTALNSLSTAFAQAVQQVRNGEVPQFSPEALLREESGGKPLITVAELVKRVSDYKVRVADGNGGFTTAPIYYDAKETMGRIQTLGDIGRELPVLKKAMRSGGGSYSRDGIEWSSITPVLESLAAMQGKLDSGESFALFPDPNMSGADGRRQMGLAQGHPLGLKLSTLNDEMVIAVLRRFYPSIPAGEKAAPTKLLADWFEQAKTGRQYREILTLQQLVQQLTPSTPLVPSQEVTAITHYLAGLRQADEFSEPRLATYYLQKAAAIRSDIIPVVELKERLQRLKKDHPEDYQKGIDDLFKVPDYDARYTQGAWSQGQLTVPAAKQ